MTAVQTPEQRRESQRTALVDAAERVIASQGLAGLKARDLARELGIALGSIYNLVGDMDELVLRVGSRTLARLDDRLARVVAGRTGTATPDAATGMLVAIARAYLAFASEEPMLWRALFEFRGTASGDLPEWSAADQLRLFRHVEAPLTVLLPDATGAERSLMARTLFSAVHGVISLGLDGWLVSVPAPALQEQIERLVRATCSGLAARG